MLNHPVKIFYRTAINQQYRTEIYLLSLKTNANPNKIKITSFICITKINLNKQMQIFCTFITWNISKKYKQIVYSFQLKIKKTFVNNIFKDSNSSDLSVSKIFKKGGFKVQNASFELFFSFFYSFSFSQLFVSIKRTIFLSYLLYSIF